MYANYHTHTYLSNHAIDTPRDYVESAVAGGTKLLGFSDHVPYPFANGHPSGFRIAVADTEKYVTEIAALRDAYADRIRIFIGYEAEYYPDEFAAMLANIRRFTCDYLILGQHYTNNEYDGVYVYSKTDDRDMLSRYVNQVIAGMETGLFTYMAHPDLAFYRGDDAFYEAEMTRLCRAAKACGMPLEINLLGLRDRRAYPYDRFWEIAAAEGCGAILGRDAHDAAALSDAATEAAGRAYAARFGLHLCETVELRPVKQK